MHQGLMNDQPEDVSAAVQALLGLSPLPEQPGSMFKSGGNSQNAIDMSGETDEDTKEEHVNFKYTEQVVVRKKSPSYPPTVLTSSFPTKPSTPTLSSPNAKISNLHDMPPVPGTVSLSGSSVGSSSVNEGPFYTGSCLLALPEDEENLSALHCFMRKFCVEVFTRGSGFAVGIRCQHCKHRGEGCAERSECYPSSLKNIYHSIETWQRRHYAVCRDIPSWCKREIATLMQNSRSGAGGRRSYWEESAKRIGLKNTENGIRFIHPPGSYPIASRPISTVPLRPSCPLVHPDDMDLDITGFLYMLMDQMETCYFSEQDRVGGRSKVKKCHIGYPGIQCKHCGGKAGFGRYFPLSRSSMTSANSDRNVYNHITKCRKCPDHIRETLVQLMDKHGDTAKNKRGTRKGFFERIWARMHQPQHT